MFTQLRTPGFFRVPAPFSQFADWLSRQLARVASAAPSSLGKHLFDLLLAIVLLPFALVLMAVISIAILIDSGRPVLFVQDRIGRGGRRFRMYKFRTLRKDYSDSSDREFMQAYIQGRLERGADTPKPALHKPFRASQVTRVGAILRKTSLDEVPQIFNVLQGEMSWVGPRPNVPWEVAAYYAWHTERAEVLPGITGLAQVRGRSGLIFDQMARYDIEYVRKQSLALDLKIIWWTIESILSGRGAG